MNQPDRFELVTLPEGVKKISINLDTRLPNAASVEIQREDHTVGALLKAALLQDKRVLFAGYKVPHPLEHSILLKIQTIEQTNPCQVLKDAIEILINDVSTIKLRFEEEFRRVKEAANFAHVYHDRDVDY